MLFPSLVIVNGCSQHSGGLPDFHLPQQTELLDSVSAHWEVIDLHRVECSFFWPAFRMRVNACTVQRVHDHSQMLASMISACLVVSRGRTGHTLM
mmetsp:Transcript_75814/g.190713  ORF Transcript_75814/g.190713 Transcript_75814/m.190713 type:complete len:95 (-) Transcript_75814:38-322(-)